MIKKYIYIFLLIIKIHFLNGESIINIEKIKNFNNKVILDFIDNNTVLLYGFDKVSFFSKKRINKLFKYNINNDLINEEKEIAIQIAGNVDCLNNLLLFVEENVYNPWKLKSLNINNYKIFDYSDNFKSKSILKFYWDYYGKNKKIIYQNYIFNQDKANIHIYNLKNKSDEILLKDSLVIDYNSGILLYVKELNNKIELFLKKNNNIEKIDNFPYIIKNSGLSIDSSKIRFKDNINEKIYIYKNDSLIYSRKEKEYEKLFLFNIKTNETFEIKTDKKFYLYNLKYNFSSDILAISYRKGNYDKFILARLK